MERQFMPAVGDLLYGRRLVRVIRDAQSFAVCFKRNPRERSGPDRLVSQSAYFSSDPDLSKRVLRNRSDSAGRKSVVLARVDRGHHPISDQTEFLQAALLHSSPEVTVSIREQRVRGFSVELGQRPWRCRLGLECLNSRASCDSHLSVPFSHPAGVGIRETAPLVDKIKSACREIDDRDASRSRAPDAAVGPLRHVPYVVGAQLIEATKHAVPVDADPFGGCEQDKRAVSRGFDPSNVTR